MSKTNYDFHIYLNPEDVRTVCIKHDFYTSGTNEEYSAMLEKCGEVTADQLAEIAQDIVEHTPEDNEYLREYEPFDEVLMYLKDLLRVYIKHNREVQPSNSDVRRCGTAKRRA